MIISSEDELEKLKDIGRICGRAVKIMAEAMEPGMTTRELDAIGRKFIEGEGAQSAPEFCYQFPGATCISINEEVAHGIPGDRVIAAGDLINIDVSAVKDGFFGDTGSSFAVGKADAKTQRLVRDGKRALWVGLSQVKTGGRLAAIGEAIGTFARKNRYTLIQNLASHGVGRSLHEEPTEISTWPDPDETRIMEEGQVFTIEPFLSLGANFAEDGDKDNWTLFSSPKALTVQFEHTLVVTKNGPLILTLAD
jgi:methionyl aminopeptidase